MLQKFLGRTENVVCQEQHYALSPKYFVNMQDKLKVPEFLYSILYFHTHKDLNIIQTLLLDGVEWIIEVRIVRSKVLWETSLNLFYLKKYPENYLFKFDVFCFDTLPEECW